MIIYKIINKITKDIYIGKTKKSIQKRFSQHINNASRGSLDCPKLYNAIRKYGIENLMCMKLYA
jgi:hypothetical protein